MVFDYQSQMYLVPPEDALESAKSQILKDGTGEGSHDLGRTAEQYLKKKKVGVLYSYSIGTLLNFMLIDEHLHWRRQCG
jgi:hypothetical protein